MIPASDANPIPKCIGPELLAPAGDRECAVAAVENGADAVYFGLSRHNARIRAANFGIEDLPDLIALLHGRGVRGYLTLNTLIFPRELAGAEDTVRRVAEAGVDAVIVQDLGLVRLIRAIAPDLEIHASTQMSVTGAEGVRLARELGCSRVILARELSLNEIGRIRKEAELPVEVFVHGALCVAYSGQCLTSEALGGRSANRGECAQACRMPYQIVCDGEEVDLGRIQYLLSPQDLAAYDLIPQLIELGVSSLKIEGRLKSPEYVAQITRDYRKAIDSALAGRAAEFSAEEVRAMEMTFSRGFSHGFLDGNDHKVLVRGDYAKKRGIALGRIASIQGRRIRLESNGPIKPGDGIVFDGDDAMGVPEQGGRVYEVRPIGPGRLELAFGHRDLDTRRLVAGQAAWKTDDPALTRKLRATFEGGPRRLVPLDLRVEARVGSPLRIEAHASTGFKASAVAEGILQPAIRHPSNAEEIREQLERFGATIYRAGKLDVELEGSPLVPRSQINALRREVVAKLDALAAIKPPMAIAAGHALPALRGPIVAEKAADKAGFPPSLGALCRNTEQAEAAAESGVGTIYLEYQELKRQAEGVRAVRKIAPGCRVIVATPRIEKPAERPLFAMLARQEADGILVRNAGGLFFCEEQGIPWVADFSMNAANELSVAILKERGATRVTASYDLSAEQLCDLLDACPGGWLEIVIHQYMPMFHMEHCVFCAFLSPGNDHTNCGRPCDSHEVKLRDRVGMEHPLKADIGCRNTLYHAIPQTAAEFLPRLIARGARHLRVEFLDDSPADVRRILALYREVLDNKRDGKGLWRELKASSQYGVTRGQLTVLA
ncbi:MAG: DUF3656 domain-containing protein [Isosphaeraceae bacterium]